MPKVSPDTLMIVNGEPVSGWLADIIIGNGGTSERAFEETLRQVLIVQAGKRLGLTATEEEAVAFLKKEEASWANDSAEERAKHDALQIAQNLPTSEIWRDPEEMKRWGIPMVTMLKVGEYVNKHADRHEVIPGTGIFEPDTAMSDFLAQERANATIIDCRTEDCSAAAAAD
ncbi:MAG: hypothetical protein WBD55_12070 [Dehalococcoidia bacterium]